MTPGILFRLFSKLTIIESNKGELIIYLDCMMGICHVRIPPSVTLVCLAIAHDEIYLVLYTAMRLSLSLGSFKD